jgi:hypothetical protein
MSAATQGCALVLPRPSSAQDFKKVAAYQRTGHLSRSPSLKRAFNVSAPDFRVEYLLRILRILLIDMSLYFIA